MHSAVQRGALLLCSLLAANSQFSVLIRQKMQLTKFNQVDLLSIPYTVVASYLKAGFHLNRIVTYRSIFFCVETISSTLVLRKQRNTIRFGTIRLKWKPAFRRVFSKPKTCLK